MGLFFGTDGLRGKVNDDLSQGVVYKCGNALATKHTKAKILIGRDTRISGSMLTLAFASGALNAGANVVDVGVCPTAGLCYLTKLFGFDYGVIVSASHNPAEYNGIKIFDSNGNKISDKFEEELERLFLRETIVKNESLGVYEQDLRLAVKYEEFLSKSISTNLSKKTIILDSASGSSFKLAPAVFRDNKAKIVATFCKPDGLNINKSGAMHLEQIKKYVLKYKADMGFAFDGDGDRVLAIDENGNVVDGDKMLYIFALDYLKRGKLANNVVVGTRHTNMGMELALNKKGIKLIRTNIGDKYVKQAMVESGSVIGGEQSGHIIFADKLGTGDGILTALSLAEICAKENKKLSELADFEPYKQCNINVVVKDKMKTINSERLANITENQEKFLEGKGRVMIHVSGTEPYIRVMVETQDEMLSQSVAEKIANVINDIDKEI